MAKVTITIYVDRNTDRDEALERDASEIKLEPYGVELKAASSKLVVPWHRIRKIRYGG